MDAEQVALALVQWAINKGVMPAHAAVGQPNEAVPLFQSAAAEDAAASIFGRAGVDIIGFNNATRQVVVYHPRRLTKKDQANLPTEIEGVAKIAYKKSSGEAHIDGQVNETAAGVNPSTPYNGKMTCGSSIGVGIFSGAGTLGCLVKDAAGQVYGLTCNHVTAGSNHSPAGLPVVAPGPCDMMPGFMDPFCLGYHAAATPILFGIPGAVNHMLNMDAALFRVKDPAMVSSMQRDAFDTPAEVGDPDADMAVEKVGRSTGKTAGKITSIAAIRVPVEYSLPQVNFTGRAYFEPVLLVESTAGDFAQRGDSGSLVVSVGQDGTRKAVGIVFAVSGTRAIVAPLKPILERFNVTIVSGHDAGAQA